MGRVAPTWRHVRRRRGSVELVVAVVVAAGLAAVQRASPATMGLVAATALAAVVLWVGLRTCFPPTDDDVDGAWMRVATWATFGLHLGLGLLITSSVQLVETFGGDAVTYHLGASEIVGHWRSGTAIGPELLPVGKEGFMYGLGGVYWVFGTSRGAGLAAVALFAAITVPVVSDTTRRLYGGPAARVAALTVMALPGFLVWTSQLLREPVILCLLAVAANATVRLTHRMTLPAYVVLGASIAVLLTLRANVAIVAAAGLLVALVLAGDHLVAGIVKGLAVLALVALVVATTGIGSRGYQLTTNADLRSIDEIRRALARTANSGILPDADISTGRRAAEFLPLALVNFSFGPFPWQATNVRQLGGALEALTVWALVPSLWRGWRAARMVDRRWMVLVVPAVAIAATLSLLLGNYGTIVRERLQVMVLLVPIAAYGWTRRGVHTRRGSPSARVLTPTS